MFLRTSGNRPLTSKTEYELSHKQIAGAENTFADGHGSDRPLDSVLAFVGIPAVEIDTELKIFAFPRSSDTHDTKVAVEGYDSW